MRNIFFICAFALFIISCNLGSETNKISGNNFFRNNGKGDRMIVSNNIILHKITIYPDVIDFAYNKDYIIAKQEPEKKNFISYLGFDLYTRFTSYLRYKESPKIFTENNDENFERNVEWDSVNYKMFFERGASEKNSSKDIQISWAIADSLIDNDPYYKKIFSRDENYWIIFNPKDTLIGPLTRGEFLKKRKELHIPADLKLK